MNVINIQNFQTPVGELILGAFNNKLVMCDWLGREKRESIDKRLQKNFSAQYVKKDCPLLDATRNQLNEYFSGSRYTFSIPLHFVGTDFQKSVWQALLAISYAHTSSYLELAQNINNVKAVRAVANANGANAISIFIPCHRIIGKKGDLVGYAGGLSAKKILLELEQKNH